LAELFCTALPLYRTDFVQVVFFKKSCLFLAVQYCTDLLRYCTGFVQVVFFKKSYLFLSVQYCTAFPLYCTGFVQYCTAMLQTEFLAKTDCRKINHNLFFGFQHIYIIDCQYNKNFNILLTKKKYYTIQ
jgi:hypothetical protein